VTSRQFGSTSAPIIPHRVQAIFGPNEAEAQLTPSHGGLVQGDVICFALR
jgi:hypothetical protein